MGVDRIVGITLPVLKILYPVIIVLVGLVFADHWLIGNSVYQVAVYTTLIVSIVDVIGQTLEIMPLQRLIAFIPLSDIGFPWVIPTLVVVVICKVMNLKVAK